MNQNIVKPVGVVAVIVAVAIGAWVLAGSASESSNESASANGPGNGQMQGGPPPGASGYGSMGGPPGGAGGPGELTEVTGEAADNAENAALEATSGEVERVLESPMGDGYLVMVVKSDDSRVMVEVSSDFKTAEVREGGPGQGGPPPGMDGPPANNGTSDGSGAGAAPSSTS